MELIKINLNSTDIKRLPCLVATIGQFDGVHQGHLTLLKKTLEIGQIKKLKTAVITFNPHPDYILGKSNQFSYIMPFEEKVKYIESLGFDYLIVFDFNIEFSKLSPYDFINNCLLKLNVVETVVGYDFCFGTKGLGKAVDIERISEYKITNHIIDKVSLNENKISSEDVKKSLNNGDVELASKLLGRHYEIKGIVVYGNQIGRTINVPTANIDYNENYALLGKGVYSTIVIVDDKKYLGITNVGNNPTFNYTKTRKIETHIINFNNDIYGKDITLKFLEKIRNEIKFKNVEEFLEQIEKDKKYTLNKYQILL